MNRRPSKLERATGATLMVLASAGVIGSAWLAFGMGITSGEFVLAAVVTVGFGIIGALIYFKGFRA